MTDPNGAQYLTCSAVCTRVLPLLFQTRVRLQPPTDSVAAAKYADQLQKDAASSGIAANHAVLAGLAADRRCAEPCVAFGNACTDQQIGSRASCCICEEDDQSHFWW